MLTGIQWSVASPGTAQRNRLWIRMSVASSCMDPRPELSPKCPQPWPGLELCQMPWPGFGSVRGCGFEREKQESLYTVPSAALGCWGHRVWERSSASSSCPWMWPGGLFRAWAAHCTMQMPWESVFCCAGEAPGAPVPGLWLLCCQRSTDTEHGELGALQRALWVGSAGMCSAQKRAEGQREGFWCQPCFEEVEIKA